MIDVEIGKSEGISLWQPWATILLTPLFSLKCAFSLPNVEPRVFWSTETTVIPKSTLGKRRRTQVFQDF